MYRLSMDSFSSLIMKLGGPTAVAADLDLEPGTVQKMKDRDSIKPKHWPRFVQLADEKGVEGVTLELLARLATRHSEAA